MTLTTGEEQFEVDDFVRLNPTEKIPEFGIIIDKRTDIGHYKVRNIHSGEETFLHLWASNLLITTEQHLENLGFILPMDDDGIKGLTVYFDGKVKVFRYKFSIISRNYSSHFNTFFCYDKDDKLKKIDIKTYIQDDKFNSDMFYKVFPSALKLTSVLNSIGLTDQIEITNKLRG